MATKKPALSSATPNDEESNALFDAHDLLTERLADPAIPNRTLIIGVAHTTYAGGVDAAGARLTGFQIDHIEIPLNEAQDKKVADLLTLIHRQRTSSSVSALQDPVEQTALDGIDADEIPDVDA